MGAIRAHSISSDVTIFHTDHLIVIGVYWKHRPRNGRVSGSESANQSAFYPFSTDQVASIHIHEGRTVRLQR